MTPEKTELSWIIGELERLEELVHRIEIISRVASDRFVTIRNAIHGILAEEVGRLGKG